MMRYDGRDRLMLRDGLQSVRQFNEGVTVLFPTVVETPTYDRDTGAARDVSVGDGTGRTFTWTAVHVQAMLRAVDVHLITFGAVPPGAEVGDLLIAVGVRDGDTFVRAKRTELAYVWARGERYRPWGINGVGIARAEEIVVALRKAGQTVARHPQY